MRHTIIIIAIVVAVSVLLPGCQPKDDSYIEEQGLLFVVRDIDGKPVPGADVRVTGGKGRARVLVDGDGNVNIWLNMPHRDTDKNGELVKSGLDVGDMVTALKLGYKTIEVEIEPARDLYEIKLEPCRSFVELTVVDSETKVPVPGAVVRRYNDSAYEARGHSKMYWHRYWRDFEEAIAGRTDGKGVMKEELFPHVYFYNIKKEGYESLDGHWKVEEGDVTRVTVPLIRRSAEIAVKVTDPETGKAVPGTKVYALRMHDSWHYWDWCYEAPETENPVFRIDAVPGAYVIKVDTPGYRRVITQPKEFRKGPNDVIVIELEKKDVRIEGVVYNRNTGKRMYQPNTRLWIHPILVEPMDDHTHHAVVTYKPEIQADGSFSQVLAPGFIQVHVRAWGHAPYVLDKVLVPDEGTFELKIELEPVPALTARIEGIVRDKITGEPQKDIEVSVRFRGDLKNRYYSGEEVYETITDSKGRFVAKAPPGNVGLRFYAYRPNEEGKAYYQREFITLEENETRELEIEIGFQEWE